MMLLTFLIPEHSLAFPYLIDIREAYSDYPPPYMFLIHEKFGNPSTSFLDLFPGAQQKDMLPSSDSGDAI